MTPKQRERQAAFEEMRKASAVKDPDQKMDAMAEFVKSHGEFMKDGGDGPFNIAFGARDYIKANHNAERVKAKLTAIDDAFPASATLGKSAYESYIAKSLLSSSVALDYAESQVKSSIELLHEDEYVESKKAVHGEVTHTLVKKWHPIEDYLRAQGRFAHLFEAGGAQLQRGAKGPGRARAVASPVCGGARGCRDQLCQFLELTPFGTDQPRMIDRPRLPGHREKAV